MRRALVRHSRRHVNPPTTALGIAAGLSARCVGPALGPWAYSARRARDVLVRRLRNQPDFKGVIPDDCVILPPFRMPSLASFDQSPLNFPHGMPIAYRASNVPTSWFLANWSVL